MDHRTTPKQRNFALHTVLRSPPARRVRRRAITVAAVLAGRLRSAAAAALALTVAAGTAAIAAAFALAALVRGLEQVMPTWAAYGVTASLLLACAALAAGVATWIVVRLTRSPRPAESSPRSV
ncbi:hypothetical protein [Nocardia neocaledoniensis]|uniref:hypothetical protein n=1 Tax=Nocardia neocaledoniensis TaxID=236511 RepID=UPI0024551E1A|nr:hypothetical protein [Nocardia neocaledoniensis]